MFKVNNKNTITTGTYFTSFSNVSIFEFEQVNVSWEMSRFQCNQKRAYPHMRSNNSKSFQLEV